MIGDEKLKRIKALRSFSDVNEGDVGGFIESESNLSHDGDCWIYHNAKVYGHAVVSGNAKVMDEAEVYDNAELNDDAVMSGSTKAFQKCKIYGKANIGGFASIYGCAEVFGDSEVRDFARVMDDGWVYGNVRVSGFARITRKCTVTPIVLQGFDYDITIMDEHISIDCQTKAFDEWREITREEAFAMDGKKAMKFFKHIPDTLEFMVKKYRHGKTNV